MEEERSLFPLMVYGRIFACPATVTPEEFRYLLAQYLEKPLNEIEFHGKVYGGYNYVWNESESLSFSTIPWIIETIKPIIVIARRIISLTSSIEGKWRLVCPISTSSVVTGALYKGFYSFLKEIKATAQRIKNIEFNLDDNILARVEVHEEDAIMSILGIRVTHPAYNPRLQIYQSFTKNAGFVERLNYLKSAADLGHILSIETAVEGIPILLKRNGELTIYRSTFEWDKLPALISHVYNFFGGVIRSD